MNKARSLAADRDREIEEGLSEEKELRESGAPVEASMDEAHSAS